MKGTCNKKFFFCYSLPYVYDNRVKQITLCFELLEIRRTLEKKKSNVVEKDDRNVTLIVPYITLSKNKGDIKGICSKDVVLKATIN
jgi:hypothetical protein